MIEYKIMLFLLFFWFVTIFGGTVDAFLPLKCRILFCPGILRQSLILHFYGYVMCTCLWYHTPKFCSYVIKKPSFLLAIIFV